MKSTQQTTNMDYPPYPNPFLFRDTYQCVFVGENSKCMLPSGEKDSNPVVHFAFFCEVVFFCELVFFWNSLLLVCQCAAKCKRKTTSCAPCAPRKHAKIVVIKALSYCRSPPPQSQPAKMAWPNAICDIGIECEVGASFILMHISRNSFNFLPRKHIIL